MIGNERKEESAAAIHSLLRPTNSQQNIFMGTLPLWRLPTLLMMMGEGEGGKSMHVECHTREGEREACRLSEEDKVLAAALAPHSHSFCFDVSNIAAEAYAKSVWFLADGVGHQGTRRNSLAFSPSSYSRGGRADRHTIESISFRPAIIDAHLPFPPLLALPLSSSTAPLYLSIHPCRIVRRIQSARSNQSLNPNNADGREERRRNGLILLIHGNAAGGAEAGERGRRE